MPFATRSTRSRLLSGDSPRQSQPHLFTALLGLLMVGLGCGGTSLQDETPSGSALGRAALAGEAPTCVTFQRGASGGVADAKISHRQPDKNFGQEPVASASQVNGHVEQVLLRFDTQSIPSQATVTSATLTVWQVNSGRPSALRAHAITGPWAEDSVTWRGFGAAYDPSVAASVESSGPSPSSARTMDVTALASAWVSGPSGNHGLLLEQSEGKTLIDTSESPHADRRPRLEVCYTEIPDGTVPSGTSLLLRVVDPAGNPIRAAISSQEAVFPTDSSGHYLFEELRPGRFFARVDALGYTSATAVVELNEGAHMGYQVKLLPQSQRFPLQAGQGGVVQTEQVRVTLPPGGIVDALGRPVTGTVEVSIAPLDPTTQLALMPGPLEGTTAASETVPLESFFMAEVSLWANGAPVHLAHGATATLEFVLSETLSRRLQAGDTMPAWWFDLDAGLWREEGVGTLKASETQPGRLVWEAQVSHFTWWNADRPWTDKNCVNVFLRGQNGLPLAHRTVWAEGVDYTGLSYGSTGPDGRVCIELKRGGKARVYAGLQGSPVSTVAEVQGTDAPAVCGQTGCMDVLLIDESVICAPGAYRECPYSGPADKLGQGSCTAGRRHCGVLGTEWSACEGEVLPTAESCSSPFDDNCDGEVNEGCTCASQEGQTCYRGPAQTRDVGSCHGGTVQCDLFGNLTCQGQQLPRTESCATLEDDDCDGSNECSPVSKNFWQSVDMVCLGAMDIAVDSQGNTLHLLRDFTSGFAWSVEQVSVSEERANWRKSLSIGVGWNEQAFIVADRQNNAVVGGAYTGQSNTTGRIVTTVFAAKVSASGQLLWSHQFEGDSESSVELNDVTTDADGNVYFTGIFAGTLRLGDRALSTGSPWQRAGFIARMEAGSGATRWLKSVGTSGVRAAVDPSGSLMLMGSFFGTFTLDGVQLTATAGGTDLFAVKLDPTTGVASEGTRTGTASVSETLVEVTFDRAGNRVMVMSLWNPSTGETSKHLAKVDPTGAMLWSRNLGNLHPEVAVDAAGNVLLFGNFWGTVDFGGGPRSSTAQIPFLAWYDTTGDYLMDRNYPGGIVVHLRGADITSDGDVVMGGLFQGTVDFGTGPKTASCWDTFVVRVDPTP